MQYNLVKIDGIGESYQEISGGAVVRYTDLNGVTLFQVVPAGLGSEVIAADQNPAWALPDVQIVVEEPVAAPSRRLTKLAFVGRLGADFYTILMAAKQSVDVEMFVKMLDWATPEADGTSVDLDDPRVAYALNQLEAGGLIAAGRAAEILGA